MATSTVKAVLPWIEVKVNLWVRPYYDVPFDNELENEAAYVTYYDELWNWEIDEDQNLRTEGHRDRIAAMRECDTKLLELGYRFLEEKFAILV